MKTLGFTFDEKILAKMSLEAFFYDLPPFDAIELAPDEKLLDLKTYKKIVDRVTEHHFHVPYFVTPGKYDFSCEHYKSDYTKFFSIIESLRQYSVKTPSIIVHGCQFVSDKNKAIEKTRQGLDLLLNFIEQKRLDFNLHLETQQKHFPISNRQDILKIVNDFDHPRLSICLDMSHDCKNYQTAPHEQFLEKVRYVHLHHEHDSFQHIPLTYMNDIDLECHHNIELLMSHCDTYRQTLISDIQAFNRVWK
ncbi:TIM barrel protein [Acidaminobacter sp. JC074]|uniref:TIM barrel protein n=1 Tax=Acidaminobacter sp. JC074 TaxID=2530199 RepID=UPI001F0F6636|nr:TIM barrel protein [Acidaminobacter sp. JC074]MCH4890565.1 TIM barrel protein [Acidaminobacter sp. JC074]